MNILQVIEAAMAANASDVFIIAGLPVTLKINGVQHRMEMPPLRPSDTKNIITEIYSLAQRNIEIFTSVLQDDDFSFAIANGGRYRVNVLRQRGSYAAVMRIIRFGLPKAEELGIPPQVLEAAKLQKGLVLVTGAAGSGKSTTLACIVDQINKTRQDHIITIEDPIEYIHRHDKCIVTQREIASDTGSYVDALRSALRESPNVILLGEMRDRDTMEVAMTAAETGQLLFSTLHTVGAANTVDRIIDVFPAHQQQQVRIQLSMVLQCVFSQQLVPALDGTLVPAFEIMHSSIAIKNLIREAKTHQIASAMSASPDMITMDASLLALVKQQRISKDTASVYCQNIELMTKKLQELP